ncbi:hypothetical protein NDU88_003614 [Pleurodeles waltl]|uniref:Uncharacterized protein n=1 Tax=Pleurodeles waltl TaxID=8319 RepID=A0AAV7MBK3_PLEWA|nr:hypothetical protein NDU88_003614 [Pleurodeles waltl]
MNFAPPPPPLPPSTSQSPPGGGQYPGSLGSGPPLPFTLSNSGAIRAEIQRFESVHPNIYAIYDLVERIEDQGLQSTIREHVIAIEGEYLTMVVSLGNTGKGPLAS